MCNTGRIAATLPWGTFRLSIKKFSSDFLGADEIGRSTSKSTAFFRLAKRTSDIVVSLILLPGLLLCAVFLLVLNWKFNPGQMIYSQERIGQRGRIFRIYKFRTMMCEGTARPARFAPQETDRISRLGHFMRATRIDELPQILNVLKGEMSLVGPRPEQVEFYRQYEHAIPGYARRQIVRPGITGLAQLKYGYTSDEAGTARKLKWDLEYINRQGFGIETHIMWQTFLFVMARLLRVKTKTKL